ncbi:MAG: hypothetical protein ACFFBD_07610 [Candidatus Hodarchaeota archaeon]
MSKKWKNLGIVKRECPDCGADLVRSTHPLHRSGYPIMVWKRPWRKNKLITVNPQLPIFAWTCMECGRVVIYMEQMTLNEIKKEYEEVLMEGHTINSPNSIPKFVKQGDW